MTLRGFWLLEGLGCLIVVACAVPAHGPEPGRSPIPVLQSRIAEAVDRLVAGRDLEVVRLSIGNITYQDSGVGSEFSAWFVDRLGRAIHDNPRAEEFEREKLDRLIAELKLSQSDLLDPSTVAPLGLLKGVHGIVEGRYYVRDDDVEAQLSFVELATGAKQRITVVVPRSEVPPNVSFVPDNAADLARQDEAFGREGVRDFGLEVWVDRGFGGTYREGEALIVFVRAERDCYVKLIHVSVDGSMQLIFPNKFEIGNQLEAGRIYKIGGPGYGFAFTMKPPFGAETIRAVASTYQFADIAGVIEAARRDTVVYLGAATTENIRDFKARGLRVEAKRPGPALPATYPPLSPEPLAAEAKASYTIIRR